MFASLIEVADSGRSTRLEGAAPDRLEQRPAAVERVRGAGGDDAQLSRGSDVRPPEDWSGDEDLAGFRVLVGQRANGAHPVRAHDHVDRPTVERLDDAPGAERDLEQDLVVREHRHHDLCVRARLRDRRRHVRPAGSKLGRLLRCPVPDRERVAAREDASCDRGAHPAGADEADAHRLFPT